MTVTNETLPHDVLVAYADGTLDGAARAKLEAQAENDPMLAGKLAALRKVAARHAADAAPFAADSPFAANSGPAHYQMGPLSLSTPQLIVAWIAGMALVLGIGFITGKRFHALHHTGPQPASAMVSSR